MDRKDFLNAIGMGAASVALFNCIGCSKGDTGNPSTVAPSNVDFTLDLTTTANAALKNNGGYVYASGIIIARTTSGTYIAVSKTCTHQVYDVVFKPNTNQFYCPNHGATFNQDGTSLGIETKKPLVQYKTSLTGNSLRIYS